MIVSHSGCGEELPEPGIEDLYFPLSEPRQPLTDLVYSQFPVDAVWLLGIEEIGKTDDPFGNGNRNHVPVRQGEILPNDVLSRQAHADVPFANHRMFPISFTFKNLPPQDAMTEIGGGSPAPESRGTGPDDTDIVKESRLFDKLQCAPVKSLGNGNRKRLTGNETAVFVYHVEPFFVTIKILFQEDQRIQRFTPQWKNIIIREETRQPSPQQNITSKGRHENRFRPV